MRKITYFIEAMGLAENEDGSSAIGGISINIDLKYPLGYIPFSELTKGKDPAKLLARLGVLPDSWLKELTDVRFITPEEFESKYGGEDDVS